MTALNKQALRQTAEKATPGPWEMEHENIWFRDTEGYTKHLMYAYQGDDVDDQQDYDNTAYIAAFNPKVVLALLDELEAAEKHIAELDKRTPYGYLRQCDGQIQISIGSERPHDRSGGYATPWFAIYTAAGIGVKGE